MYLHHDVVMKFQVLGMSIGRFLAGGMAFGVASVLGWACFGAFLNTQKAKWFS